MLLHAFVLLSCSGDVVPSRMYYLTKLQLLLSLVSGGIPLLVDAPPDDNGYGMLQTPNVLQRGASDTSQRSGAMMADSEPTLSDLKPLSLLVLTKGHGRDCVRRLVQAAASMACNPTGRRQLIQIDGVQPSYRTRDLRLQCNEYTLLSARFYVPLRESDKKIIQDELTDANVEAGGASQGTQASGMRGQRGASRGGRGGGRMRFRPALFETLRLQTEATEIPAQRKKSSQAPKLWATAPINPTPRSSGRAASLRSDLVSLSPEERATASLFDLSCVLDDELNPPSSDRVSSMLTAHALATFAGLPMPNLSAFHAEQANEQGEWVRHVHELFATRHKLQEYLALAQTINVRMSSAAESVHSRHIAQPHTTGFQDCDHARSRTHFRFASVCPCLLFVGICWLAIFTIACNDPAPTWNPAHTTSKIHERDRATDGRAEGSKT
jgi:hypothetical protein